jgi:hypothetical protein
MALIWSGLVLAIFLLIASITLFRRLPKWMQKLILRHPIVVEIFASIGIYIVLGLSIVAHMAAAMFAGFVIVSVIIGRRIYNIVPSNKTETTK